jgi:predicted RNase H-like HicB family nuclease
MDYTVILHKAEEGGYWVEVPALSGCFSQGETIEEALQNVQEAIALHLEVMAEEGQEPPSDEGWLIARVPAVMGAE